MTNNPEQLRQRIAELEECQASALALINDALAATLPYQDESGVMRIKLHPFGKLRRAASLISAAPPASEPTPEQKKTAFDAEMSKPLTPLESVVVGLTLLEQAINEGDPEKELALRARDILEEVQEARDKYELSASEPDADVVERVARALLRDEIESYRESDLLLDEHIEWWRNGRANPESCVHYSSIGVAMRRARAALTAMRPADREKLAEIRERHEAESERIKLRQDAEFFESGKRTITPASHADRAELLKMMGEG